MKIIVHVIFSFTRVSAIVIDRFRIQEAKINIKIELCINYGQQHLHKHLILRTIAQIHKYLIQPLQAAASGGSNLKGDPLYAELEHKKGKRSIIIPPEMTGTQCSEINTSHHGYCYYLVYRKDKP